MSAHLTPDEKLRARRSRYDRSEKGRARHERYNHSDMGHARWLRYEEGMVGITHRLADSMRKRWARTEREHEKYGLTGPLPALPKLDYNSARQTDAICARRRELGWDFRADGLLGPVSLQRIREDAAPPKVVDEVCALWRMRPAERFTHRERAA